MNGIHKLLAPVCGMPLLAHTLLALQDCASITEIVIAARSEDMVAIYDICTAYGIGKTTKVVRGGDSRLHSVLLALGEVSEHIQLVAVHDGARPLVRPEDVDAVVAKAAQFGAAILSVPVKDTVKEIRDGTVSRTPDRALLRAAQTPQVFDVTVLKTALAQAAEKNIDVTDDSRAVELLGVPVHWVDGHDDNIKITTPVDLTVLAALLEERQNDENRTRV